MDYFDDNCERVCASAYDDYDYYGMSTRHHKPDRHHLYEQLWCSPTGYEFDYDSYCYRYVDEEEAFLRYMENKWLEEAYEAYLEELEAKAC